MHLVTEAPQIHLLAQANFFLIGTPEKDFAKYFVAYVFALASSTIVSGSLAERAQLKAYIIFTIFMVGFVYPVVAHWVWNDGWLVDLDYKDFAGSSVVHVTGGAAALVGCIILGARIDRFKDGRVQSIPGHSVVLLALGFFLLWFGFFAFNASSEGGIVGGNISTSTTARAAVNTSLSGSAGLLSTLLIGKLSFTKQEVRLFGRELSILQLFGGFWSVNNAVNGGLTGMVAVCAGCDVIESWAAVVIGLISGLVYTFFSRALLLLQIDDPVTAVPIHFFGGIWGVLAVGLFASSGRIDELPDGGILYAWNGDAFIFMGIQVIGVTVIAAWSMVLCAILFIFLRLIRLFRVTKNQENDGLDYLDGEPAYPMDPAILAAYADDFSEGSMSADH